MGAQLKPTFRGQRAVAHMMALDGVKVLDEAGVDPDFDDEPLDLSAGAVAVSYHLGEEPGGGELAHCNYLVACKRGLHRPATSNGNLTPTPYVHVLPTPLPELKRPEWAITLATEVERICGSDYPVIVGYGRNSVRFDCSRNGRWAKTKPPLDDCEAALIAIYLRGGAMPPAL